MLLKPSSTKTLKAYIEALAKQYDVKPEELSVNELGRDFINSRIQWNSDTTVELFTLGALQSMLDNLSSVCQFTINTANIEKILTGEKGICKTSKRHPLYTKPVIIRVEDTSSENGEPVKHEFIGGGRHRVQALLAAFEGVRGSEAMTVECLVYNFHGTLSNALEYIVQDNGSRSMTSTETGQLEFGMSLTTHSGDEFYEVAAVQRKVSEVKRLSAYGVASAIHNLKHLVNGRDIGYHTSVQLCSKFLNAFIRIVNEYLAEEFTDIKKPNITNLLCEQLDVVASEGGELPVARNQLQQVCNVFIDELQTKWETEYFPLCEQTDRKGNTSYLLAHGLGEIAKSAATLLADELRNELVATYEEYCVAVVTKKQKQAAEAQAKKAKTQKTNAFNYVSMLMNTGCTDETFIRQALAAAGSSMEEYLAATAS